MNNDGSRSLMRSRRDLPTPTRSRSFLEWLILFTKRWNSSFHGNLNECKPPGLQFPGGFPQTLHIHIVVQCFSSTTTRSWSNTKTCQRSRTPSSAMLSQFELACISMGTHQVMSFQTDSNLKPKKMMTHHRRFQELPLRYGSRELAIPWSPNSSDPSPDCTPTWAIHQRKSWSVCLQHPTLCLQACWPASRPWDAEVASGWAA